MSDDSAVGPPTSYAVRVRAVVAGIPPGRVLTYADVTALAGAGSPRSVGTVLARWGLGLPCHRVVRSDGRPKRIEPERNLARLRDEGVPLAADGSRVDLARARWSGATAASAGPAPASDAEDASAGEAGAPAGGSSYAERVLAVVERIPAGRVLTYGDVREYLGESSARAVGRVMSLHGGGVPWHRVVLSTGAPAPGHEAAALALLRAEGTPLRPGGDRVDLAVARWDGG